MAISSGFFTTILSPDTVSLLKPSPPPLRLTASPSPANLSLRRTVRYATAASKPAAGERGGVRGIMKPRRVSPEMADFIGAPEMSRTEIVKHVWAYIKENNLQDPENKKIIICDEKLKTIFAGKDQVGFLEIAGLITPHFVS